MPELRNPRWERFCWLYVELGVAAEAYRRSGYRKGTLTTITTDSSRLLTYADVKRRISELRARKLFERTLKREQLEGYLASVIETPAGDIHPQHPLCQAIEVSEKGTKVRMPDKNTAAQTLARLNGWDAPTKLELSADNPLTAYLRELRAKAVEVEPHNVQRIDDEHHTP